MKRATRRTLYTVVILGWLALSVFVWFRIFEEAPGALSELDQLLSGVPANPRNVDVEIASDLRVTGIQAGILLENELGTQEFVPQASVPIVPGQHFGWVAWLDTSRVAVSWTEVFHFTYAGPDQILGVGEGAELDTENSRVVSNQTSPVRFDAIANFWTITEGDPPGPHSFDVTIEGVHVATLDMELVLPPTTE